MIRILAFTWERGLRGNTWEYTGQEIKFGNAYTRVEKYMYNWGMRRGADKL